MKMAYIKSYNQIFSDSYATLIDNMESQLMNSFLTCVFKYIPGFILAEIFGEEGIVEQDSFLKTISPSRLDIATQQVNVLLEDLKREKELFEHLNFINWGC